MAEQPNNKRTLVDVCYNDLDNPIVGFKRQKNEVNWRNCLLSLDADGILTVRSLMEELEESSGLEEDFLLLLFCCWLKHWREVSNESEVGVVFFFLMWLVLPRDFTLDYMNNNTSKN